MEYHCTKAADVAGRIFERGMETFPDEVELALRYLGFLITINDDASKCSSISLRSVLLIVHVDARALFERAVNNFPPEKARPVWDRWTRYEYQYGTLEACHLLEKRIGEVYPQGACTSTCLSACFNVPAVYLQIHQSRGLPSDTST